MRVLIASLGLALLIGHAILGMADATRVTLDVWPGKAAGRDRSGGRGAGQDGDPAGRHDGDHQPDQRVEADPDGLPPGGREEHRRGRAGLPRRRLHIPRLGPRGGAGGPLAQLGRDHGGRAEVPRPAPGRDAQGHAAQSRPSWTPSGRSAWCGARRPSGASTRSGSACWGSRRAAIWRPGRRRNFDKRAYDPIDAVGPGELPARFRRHDLSGRLVKRETTELSPEIRVTPQTPPCFFAHAGDDPVSPENSVGMYLALKRAGVPAELHIYASGGHGFGLRPTGKPVATWPKRCEEWLRATGVLKRRRLRDIGRPGSATGEHVAAAVSPAFNSPTTPATSDRVLVVRNENSPVSQA